MDSVTARACSIGERHDLYKAICPGTVDSPSLHDRLRATGDYDQAMTDFIAHQLMGRIGNVDEIAELALYLASDASKYTTEQPFAIDGGWTI